MNTPRVTPGWSRHARAVAHFQALLRALCVRDESSIERARAELRALGLEVAPVSPEVCR